MATRRLRRGTAGGARSAWTTARMVSPMLRARWRESRATTNEHAGYLH